MKLSEIKIGETVTITNLDAVCPTTQRLIELGFSAGSMVVPMFTSISRKIRAYRIKNTLIALRDETAGNINVVSVNYGGE